MNIDKRTIQTEIAQRSYKIEQIAEAYPSYILFLISMHHKSIL